jgi:hypothetical protein
MNLYPRIVQLEQLLLTVWVGALLAIGYLAVPVLFQQLDDRRLAGELAGQMFHWVHVLGLVCGLSLLLIAYYVSRHDLSAYLRQWRYYVLLAMLLLIVLDIFVLQPQMAAIKLQVGWHDSTELMARFGMLHGIASLMYLLTSIGGVVLVLNGLRAEAGK